LQEISVVLKHGGFCVIINKFIWYILRNSDFSVLYSSLE